MLPRVWFYKDFNIENGLNWLGFYIKDGLNWSGLVHGSVWIFRKKLVGVEIWEMLWINNKKITCRMV
jgi:hypothetical protein